MASGIEQLLARINTAATDVNALTEAVSERIRQGGDIALRTSNTAYGAAAGAKAGSTAPTTVPPVVKYGAVAALAYFFLRRR